jgi:methionyl-tRNA formyltransferase
MRLIFAGTPEFAATALKSLIRAGHEINLVLTQPDRPAGRGMKLKASPVKELALSHGLPVAQPLSLKDPVIQAQLRALAPEAMVVAAYGLILPPAVLEIPVRGCLNIHASLLPRWRGAAPIQRAILADDAETGITIMQMDAGLDTGPMLLTRKCPITPEDTGQSLHDRLAALGGEAIVDALAQLDTLRSTTQDDAQASYAPKLSKDEAQLDWDRGAAELARAVRAYNPFPVAFTLLDGETLRIWAAHGGEGRGVPGTVLSMDKAGIRVACGDGALLITELQRAGGRRLRAEQFAASGALRPGTRLGA